MISLKQVSKSFDGGKTKAVNNVSFQVGAGETLVLLGASGSGKSTTLKMINRLTEPESGTIQVDNVDVFDFDPVSLRRKIGYVFQGIGLFPHMSVCENVSVIPKMLGLNKNEQAKQASELLELVELPEAIFGKRYPFELSGGQQQRVGLARALASDPEYLLMDEPFGALDPLSRDSLQQMLLHLKSRLKKTIVFVTHDIFEALTLADRIAVMNGGIIEQIGNKAELVSAPATDFVRELFARPKKQLELYNKIS